MREHMGLYRGKRICNNQWMSGNLLCYEDGDCYICVCTPYRINHYRVDPSTVGECTGLRDKNGKLIFEGDIVQISKTLFAVKWRGAEFVFGHIAGQPWSYPYFASHAESCEIIGNIHDNPELLEGGEGDA